MNDNGKQELNKLIVVTIICLLIYVIFLVNIDSIPEGVICQKEEYTITYVSPTPLVEEVPKKLWDDPPIVKEVVLATPKPQLTEEKKPEMTFLGVYELTAYEWTGNRCANGNYPTCNYTVACNSLPLGTQIFIEGMGTYVVEDRGGMADSVIDIYMGDYDTCIQFGRRTANVYIIE